MGKEKELKIVKEIATGEAWTCPICKKKHRLIHREIGGKSAAHKLVEIVE